MDFTFKDKEAKKIFENRDMDKGFKTYRDIYEERNKKSEAILNQNNKVEKNDEEDIKKEETILNQNSKIEKNVKEDKKEKLIEVIEKNNEKEIKKEEIILNKNVDLNLNIDTNIKETLKRMELKQDKILNLLNSGESLIDSDTLLLENSEIENFKLNLKLFNSNFIIYSSSHINSQIEEIYLNLNDIAEYIKANSFTIFKKEPLLLEHSILILNNILAQDLETNKVLKETISLLKEIETYSKMAQFQSYYNYSKMVLDRGLLLNAITLLNEAISTYLIDATISLSKDILIYVKRTSDRNNNHTRLYGQAKDFFINNFSKLENSNNNTPFFPHHSIIKEQDKIIKEKFKNIQNSLKNRGYTGLFEQYANITYKTKVIRNSLAHGNMDINFRDLANEIKELSEDFKYLSIDKNILKRDKNLAQNIYKTY